MIRHLFIAALRNMAANKLLSAISVLGLAIGFAGAILMALVIRSDLTYDEFLPAYDRTYVLLSPALFADFGKFTTSSDPRMANLLRLNVPEIESVVHLGDSMLPLKRGQIAVRDHIYWTDPDMFSVLPFPALYGDTTSALRSPDGIVLTRAAARKYFGRDDVVGETIAADGHPMTVRAVIKDLPLNGTTFQNDGGPLALAYRSGQASAMAAFVSNLAPFAPKPLSIEKGQISFGAPIYLRLKPGASVDNVDKAAQRLYRTLSRNFGKNAHILPIDRIHLLEDLNPGITAKLTVSAAIGFLILFIAAANFVNLAVARAARRQREVGVRKSSGASRRDLMRQFLGEALVSVTVAACIAVALVEWLLPSANAFLQTDATFDYGRDPVLALSMLLGVLAVGFAAGVYPALILSSFKPASVLKGWAAGGGYSGRIRNVLVTAQFAILIVLIIAAAVVYQQRNYAASAALRANIDQMLIVQQRGACAPAFRKEVTKLAGVVGAACTNDQILDSLEIDKLSYRGKTATLYPVRADRSVFALYGISPVAGSLRTGSDGKPAAPGLVINQGAVKELGFASPQVALGQMIGQQQEWKGARIVAVVPDFTFHSVELPMAPTIFGDLDSGDPAKGLDLHIRLRGQQIAETLAAIDRLWGQTGGQGTIKRFFLDAHLQDLYVGILRQAQLFGMFAGIAVFLACLGLVGIAVSTAERRTKEIGIRKAAGATNRDIVMMLLWQFAQPVLWANVIAWPLAWWLMQRWLSGFTYHVDLHPWLFLAASAAALAIALATVAGQAFLVARQKPVLALRYE